MSLTPKERGKEKSLKVKAQSRETVMKNGKKLENIIARNYFFEIKYSQLFQFLQHHLILYYTFL